MDFMMFQHVLRSLVSHGLSSFYKYIKDKYIPQFGKRQKKGEKCNEKMSYDMFK